MKSYLISLAAVAAGCRPRGTHRTEGASKPDYGLSRDFAFAGRHYADCVRSPRADDPDFSGFSFGDSKEAEYESIFADGVRGAGGTYLAERLCEALASRYSCPVSDFSVRFSFSENGEEVTAVLVLLRGKAVFLDTYDLEKYVEKLFSCPVTTAVGGE